MGVVSIDCWKDEPTLLKCPTEGGVHRQLERAGQGHSRFKL